MTGDTNFPPQTDTQAIEYASYFFNIDLSSVECPIEECENLINYSFDHRPIIEYQSSDPKFRQRWVFFNSELESPSLRFKFNPHFPESYYRRETLIHLCHLSLLPTEGNVYHRLTENYLEPNFFHGKANNRINSETDIWQDNIRILPYHGCLSFGIRTGKLKVLTYKELKEFFQINTSFRRIDGKEGEEYTPKQIEKLFSLTTQKIPNEDISLYHERKNLGIEIAKIKRFISGKTDECKRMLEAIGEEKEIMVNAFKSLFRLSLLMRGWDGISSRLPLKEIDSQIDPGKQGDIDIRVSEEIASFEQKCEKLKNPKLLLLLPMMYYSFGVFNFPSDKKCWSIRDRLNVVKGGVDLDEITSCIRLTSNWFLFTSCYYLGYLGEKLEINVAEVETIG